VAEPEEGDLGSYRDLRLDQLLEAFSSAAPAPGGGGAAVLVVALSASLCAMAARLSTSQMTGAPQLVTEALAIRDALAPLYDRDAHDYLDVIAARRMPDASEAARSSAPDAAPGGDADDRRKRITDALSAATDVPMAVIEAGTRLAEMAAELAEQGNPNLRGDALVAAVLAGAGVEAAAVLAQINLAGLPDDERQGVARSRLGEATRSVQRARRAAVPHG
jgi:formiminotetrahydrofolate cyclodeaminase